MDETDFSGVSNVVQGQEASTSRESVDSISEMIPVCPNQLDLDLQMSDESSYDSKEETEMSDIDELLEKDVQKYPKNASVRKKVVLEIRPNDAMNVLPDGWIEVTHDSGMPVYLHRSTRVCTFSRPYFIGKTSLRRHLVPNSSIPCYAMKKQLAERKAREEEQLTGNKQTPKVELKQAGDEDEYLNPEEMNKYASGVFKFKTMDVVRFPKWSETRNFRRGEKRKLYDDRGLVQPGVLKSDVQLITVPSFNETTRPSQRTFCMNPVNKTSVTILHEYVQKVLKSSVVYDFIILSSATTPYRCVAKLKPTSALIQIQQQQSIQVKLKLLRERYEKESSNSEQQKDAGGDEEYILLGVGFGKSKKVSKLAAAVRVLDGLIPGLAFNNEHVAISGGQEEEVKNEPAEVFELLDIDDTQIPGLSQRSGQQQPFVILQELLRRNATMAGMTPELTSEPKGHQRHQFTLRCGKDLQVSLCGGNKKDAKQRTAQFMLKKLFPKANKWSDILKIYHDQAFSMQKEAQRYQRNIASTIPDPSDETTNLSEALGLELREAMKKMETDSNSVVHRNDINWTAQPLFKEECGKFGELCQRYSHLFRDDHLVQSIIE